MQFASFVLPDGKLTPVNHTFTPRRIDAKGVASWFDMASGIPLGYPGITHALNEPDVRQKRVNFNSTSKIVLPIMEVTSASTGTGINPGPMVGHQMIANLTTSISHRSTRDDRKDFLAYIKGWVNSTEFSKSILDQEFVA